MNAKQHHAVDVLGYLSIPKHATLPDWISDSKGRLIFVEDEKIFYKGGSSSWEKYGERSSYYFPVDAPSASWGIDHNLDSPFNYITVFESGGNQIYPRNVFVEDGNRLKLEFSVPVSGAAFIMPCNQHEADFSQWTYDSTSPVTSASEPTKYFGISMYGPFYNERVEGLPTWYPIFEGRMVYNKEDGKLYYSDSTSWRESAGLQEIRVTQTAHGFVPGNIVRATEVVGSTQYLLSDGSDVSTSDVFGIVTRVIDANTFEYVAQLGSLIELSESQWDSVITDKTNIDSGLEISRIYFLSETEGEISEANATVNKPVLFAISSTKGIFAPLRGLYSTQGGDGVSAYVADINDIENVQADAVANGDVLQYQDGVWVPLRDFNWDYRTIELTPSFNTTSANPNDFIVAVPPSSGNGYINLPPDDIANQYNKIAIVDQNNSFNSLSIYVSASTLEGAPSAMSLSERYNEFMYVNETLGWIKVK